MNDLNALVEAEVERRLSDPVYLQTVLLEMSRSIVEKDRQIADMRPAKEFYDLLSFAHRHGRPYSNHDRHCINCRKYGICGAKWEGYCVNHETQEEYENRIKKEKIERLVKKLEEAEGRIMIVHTWSEDVERKDLIDVINLLNEVMAELKEGMA